MLCDRHALTHETCAANNPATLTDATIQTVLRNKINLGSLPGNGPNRLYMIYLPKGHQIPNQNACAYHSYTTVGGSNAYYTVMPYDVDRGGCRNAVFYMHDLTSMSSHEMFEAITDPALSAWFTNAFPAIYIARIPIVSLTPSNNFIIFIGSLLLLFRNI